jgi:hypothetical protein
LLAVFDKNWLVLRKCSSFIPIQEDSLY